MGRREKTERARHSVPVPPSAFDAGLDIPLDTLAAQCFDALDIPLDAGLDIPLDAGLDIPLDAGLDIPLDTLAAQAAAYLDTLDDDEDDDTLDGDDLAGPAPGI